MKLTILFSAMAALLLSGCTLSFEATFEGLSLVREEPADIVAQYSLPGREHPERPLAGRLRLDFVADTDLIGLMEDEGYNIWFKVKNCRSNVYLATWPYIYENLSPSLDERKNLHRYSVFLDSSWRNPPYDLKINPDPICVQFGAGQMAALFNYRSNTVEIGRDKVVAAFED